MKQFVERPTRDYVHYLQTRSLGSAASRGGLLLLRVGGRRRCVALRRRRVVEHVELMWGGD